MSLNRFMHPRNVYKDSPPNFKELSTQYSDLQPFVHENEDSTKPSSLDFENPAALRALTCALLHRDFGLSIDIPLNHLIPTVPSRLNYILWIEDLLQATGSSESIWSCSQEIWGLDVGAGASCIYALLGCRKNAWNFVVTETNLEAREFAARNVERNGMNAKIVVLDGDDASPLTAALAASGKTFDFCMSNPPFFASQSERQEKAAYKPLKMTGNPVAETDAVVEGGEVAFVTNMIEESLFTGNKIRICTSMLGKKSSLTALKTLLRSKNIPFITTEFCQGRTMRWGIAWSVVMDLTVNAIPRPLKSIEKPLSYSIDFGPQSETSRMEICLKVMQLLKNQLKMYILNEKSGKERSKWRVSGVETLWKNQRKRRREEKKRSPESVGVPMEVDGEGTPENGSAETAMRNVIQFFVVTKGDAFQYSVVLEWISGEKREYLNEIVVFLTNQMKEYLPKKS